MKHYLTNYATQRNRCTNCSHRRNMHGGKGCLVVNGIISDGIKIDRNCRCKEVYNGI